MTKVKLLEIIKHVDELLSIDKFKDYCPNGLQVSGALDIRKIVTGVSANNDLITKANDWSADLILVHHGSPKRHVWLVEGVCTSWPSFFAFT